MKKGLMFFFNMGNITQAARIALVPAIIFMFFARGYLMMGISALLVLVCLFFGLIHAPADEMALSAIRDFYQSFEDRLRLTTMKKEDFLYIKGYEIKGRMFLKRQVNNKVIYPVPTVASIVLSHDENEYYLMIGRLNLLKNVQPEYKKIKIDHQNLSIESTIESEDDSVMVINIKTSAAGGNIKIFVENNHTSRRFLEYAKEVIDLYASKTNH